MLRIAEPVPTYVAWTDLMGGGNLMRQSLVVLAEAIGALTEACIEATRDIAVELHPLNDGVFAVSQDRGAILRYLTRTLGILATTVVAAADQNEVRLVRATLAYGDALTISCALPTHTSSVLLGGPKSEAFHSEDDAAPFGVLVHSSAIAAGVPDAWRWYVDTPTELVIALGRYFAWARATNAYPEDRIEVHERRANDYFRISTPG